MRSVSAGAHSAGAGSMEHTTSEVFALHTVGGLRAEYGGPTRSITALCSALNRHQVRTAIVTLEPRPTEPAVASALSALDVQFVKGDNGGAALLRQRPFREALGKRLAQASAMARLLHDHGLWLPNNHSASVVTRRMGVPRMISPRGMLSSWALEFHKLKKAIAWRLFQRSDLQAANLIHVTSAAEADEVRALGQRLPIAIIPNGVALPRGSTLPARARTPASRRRALFLSRLHRKKGLLNLVEAWATVAPTDWRLTIAGPDEAGERAAAEDLARRRGLDGLSIEFVGPIADNDKWDLFASADLFVLPSFSENFGIVIAEALASGVPVITTKATPWPGLLEHDCGWWIDVGVEPLITALRQAFALEDAALGDMGARGRRFVECNFSWDSVADKMAETYRWLLYGEQIPSFVFSE